MTMSLTPLDTKALIFKQDIYDSNISSIFEVEYHGKKYALKVFHDKGHDSQRFQTEVKAYNALNASGACDSGFVPKYYGSIDRLNPAHHKPWLNSFQKDKFHPQVIVLEYLENADCLNIWNFSNERLSKATESLAWVHKALVIHNDINFENVLVVPGNSGAPERVLVVDFDVSITYPTKDLFDEATSIHSTGPIKACDDDNHWLESYGKVLEKYQRTGTQ